MANVSIVIPTYNGLQHLQRCLLSVYRCAPGGAQVLVVDDGSSDGTAAWVRANFPVAEVISLDGNQGFCRAANAGLQRARRDFVEFLNNDTEVCPGWIEAGLSHFDDPSVGSVAPLVLDMDTRHPTIDSCGQEYRLCGWAVARGYRQRVSPRFLRRADIFGASASSGFYRRSALERVGGFLPEYDAYLEDTDLAFRLHRAGYRCVYEPASRVFHRGSASYDQTSDRVIRLLSRNEEFNFWINLPPRNLMLGLMPHLAFLIVRALRKIAAGRWRPFLHGKLQALAAHRWIRERRCANDKLRRHAEHSSSIPLSSGGSVVRLGLNWLLRRQLG